VTEARDPSPGSADTRPGAPGGDDPAPQRQRLYFHVGLPKSGSTYLQTVLGNNRTVLRELGHVYPFVRQEGMFHAAVEMAGHPSRWGLEPEAISGTFAHLLRRGRRVGGTVVISHEIFGWADHEQIARMAALLEEFDVHLVLTVRDLGRTATAEWQEQVKNGHPRSFDDFVDDLLSHLPEDLSDTSRFWRSQNLGQLLDRWQEMVPAERIHVVTCPRSASPPDLLWRRFAEAVDLPADAVDLSLIPPRNESLGTAQVALLRQVVTELDGRLEQPWFSRIAKRWFAQSLLSRVSSPKPVTPAPVAERLAAVSAAWIERIREGDYRVHGDLEELLPEVTAPDAPHPDAVVETDQLFGLPQVLADMLLRVGRLEADLAEQRRENERLTRDRDDLREALHEAPAQSDAVAHRVRWLPASLRRRVLVEVSGAARQPDGEPSAE